MGEPRREAMPGIVAHRALLGRCSKRIGNARSEEHTSELQSLRHLVCRLLLEKEKRDVESKVAKAVWEVETHNGNRRLGDKRDRYPLKDCRHRRARAG